MPNDEKKLKIFHSLHRVIKGHTYRAGLTAPVKNIYASDAESDKFSRRDKNMMTKIMQDMSRHLPHAGA